MFFFVFSPQNVIDQYYDFKYGICHPENLENYLTLTTDVLIEEVSEVLCDLSHDAIPELVSFLQRNVNVKSIVNRVRAVLMLYRMMDLMYYSDVIMSAMPSQIIGVSFVCSTVCSGADQRNDQRSASMAFVRGIHRSQVDSLTKGQ